jgi:hypothetical protein
MMRSAVRRYSHHLAALLGYLALTCLFTYPLVREFGRAIPGDGFDGWQNVWNIWWVKQALLVQGTNPYYTQLLDYPAGVYLYFHTLNIFNGLTFLPVTLNAGNLAAYNTAAAFSFVAGGYGTYLLALRVLSGVERTAMTESMPLRLAAFLGGGVFAFSPYHMAHLLGHMQLISLEWLPFAALAVVMLLSRCGGRTAGHTLAAVPRCLAAAGLLALFLVLVALCDWYYAWYMVLLSGLLWVTSVLRWRAAVRSAAALALSGLLFAAATAVLWVPMVREMLAGDYMVPEPGDTVRLSADLLAFFTPSAQHPWWGEWAAGLANRFTASLSERTVFAGYAVLILAGLAIAFNRRRAAAWGAAALTFAVLAMGPVLHIGGQTRFLGMGPVSLPYALLLRAVPQLHIARSVSRFDVVVMLCLGVLAALGAAWLLGRVRRAGLVAPAAAFLALLGAISVEYLAVPYPMSFPETQPFHEALAAEPDEFAVLDVPMDGWDRPANLLFQTVHHKALVSAYTSRPNPLAPAWRTPVLQTFRNLGPDINSGDPRELAATVLHDLNVRYVIVHKNDLPPGEYREQTLALAADVLSAWPVVVDDDWLRVYRRPDEIGRRLPYLVLGDGWGKRQWDGQQPARTIGSAGATVQAHLATAAALSLQVSAYGERPATLEIAAGQNVSASLVVDVQPTVVRTPPLSLAEGETTINLFVEPPSASIVVTGLELVSADPE